MISAAVPDFQLMPRAVWELPVRKRKKRRAVEKQAFFFKGFMPKTCAISKSLGSVWESPDKTPV